MGMLKWGNSDAGGAATRLLLFPGSRIAIREIFLKWLVEAVRHLKNLIPAIRIGTLFSPFVPESEFSVWTDAGLYPLKVGAGAAMRSADYALTQPGTNTLEMMHSGLPALVAAPFDFLRVFPTVGITGYMSKVPVIGLRLKEWKIRKNLDRHKGFVAWPNRIAGRMVLDEVTGDVKPKDAAARVASALRDREKLSRVRGELLALSGEAGAVLLLCDAVENAVGNGVSTA
jgi:lipid-A-disaccharide synthase